MKQYVTIVSLLLTLTVTHLVHAKDAPTVFSCVGRSAGYYADLESGCQDYYMCDASGRRYTYSCPNQTLFQQRVMICDHWFMVDCSLSEAHFGANLLIGQKDRHFMDAPTGTELNNHEGARVYRTRTREYYSDRKTTVDDRDRRDRVIQFSKGNQVRDKNKLPVVQSDRFAVNKDVNPQFTTTPASSIKRTSNRSFPKELANNPFFRDLTVKSTQAPPLNINKGEDNLLTFLSPFQRKDHDKQTGPIALHIDSDDSSPTSRTFPNPPPSRRVPSHALQQQQQRQRYSSPATTAAPSTYDYDFVTPQGQTNSARKSTPQLRNAFKNVRNGDEDEATTEPLLTTQFEFLKNKERTEDGRVQVFFSESPRDPSVTRPPQQGQAVTSNTNQRNSSATTRDQGNQAQPHDGVHRTAGGFRFKAPGDENRESSNPGSFRSSDGVTASTWSTPSTPTTDWRFTSPEASHFQNNGNGNPTSAFEKDRLSDGNNVRFPESQPTRPEFETPWSLTSPTADYSTGNKNIDTQSATRSPDIFRFGAQDARPDAFPSSGGDESLAGGKHALVDHPAVASEDEADVNTVEVRVVDPRRMFFIPDNAVSEAEMLNSSNETVLTISLPSAKHHGAMKFKGVRGAKGRRAECPQCHPAFLQPGKCHPCVLIR